jgi:hypothetical protein
MVVLLAANLVVAVFARPALLWLVCQHLFYVFVTLIPAVGGFVAAWWTSLRLFRRLRKRYRTLLSYRTTRILVVVLVIVHAVELAWFAQAMARVFLFRELPWPDDWGLSAYKMCFPEMYH